MKNIKFKANFRKIRFFNSIVRLYGYSAEIETKRWKRKEGCSVYVAFYKDGLFHFSLRFSDHDLKDNNYLPAGVINRFYTDLNFCVSDFEDAVEDFNNMSEEEKRYLLTNRLVSELKF